MSFGGQEYFAKDQTYSGKHTHDTYGSSSHETKFSRIPVMSPAHRAFHQLSLARARNYTTADALLLEIVIDVQRTKFYELFELLDTRAYCIQILNLTPDVAYHFWYVARKCIEVPEVNRAIQNGEISISAARRLVAVINKDNCAEWLAKAKTMSISKLEREVANASPLEHAHTTERMRPIPNDLTRVEFSLTQEEIELVKRAREVLSQKLKKPVTLREIFVESLKLVCEKYDPLEKAKRQRARTAAKAEAEAKANAKAKAAEGKPFECEPNGRKTKAESPQARAEARKSNEGQSNTKSEPTPNADGSRENSKCPESRMSRDIRHGRAPIPAHVIHAVNLRDKGQCQFRRSDGSICGNKRFLEKHHIIKVSEGGPNTAENLTTLCSRCHRRLHDH